RRGGHPGRRLLRSAQPAPAHGPPPGLEARSGRGPGAVPAGLLVPEPAVPPPRRSTPGRSALMDRSSDAEATVLGFFDAHRHHNVARMAGCCADGAKFSYATVESWAKQPVVRDDKTAST